MRPAAVTPAYAGQAIFRYAGLDIRVVPGRNNQPWCLLADIYAALGMQPSTATGQKLHDRESLEVGVIETATGARSPVMVVDAPGIVYLCMVADTFGTCIDAHVFQRWVFRVPMRATRQVRKDLPADVIQVEFQFPQSHAAAVELADLMERS